MINLSNFSIGDQGISIEVEPPSGIPAGATSVMLTFLGVRTGTRIPVSAVSQGGGQYAQYIVTGLEPWLADQYQIQLSYTDTGGNSKSSPAPFPLITVSSRL